MNERIKELMEQTGVPLSMPFDKWCEKFAALVAAHEREECAKLCSAINNEYDGEGVSASWIAEAIRTRSRNEQTT